MEEGLNEEEIAADAAITDTFQKILVRSSPKIFQLAFNKLKRYVEVSLDRCPVSLGVLEIGRIKLALGIWFLHPGCGKSYGIICDMNTCNEQCCC